jgi:hypothetical protein
MKCQICDVPLTRQEAPQRICTNCAKEVAPVLLAAGGLAEAETRTGPSV